MNEIGNVFLSWQFLLVGIVVFFVFGFFNQFLGPRLWRLNKAWLRRFLKVMESFKMIWPPLLGFALGWIPWMPRPAALEGTHQFAVALLYLVAGLFSLWIVKGVKKYLESRGINIDLDFTPKEQKKVK
jgi:hypothetical protein